VNVVVLDYGSGNLRSAERALARAGADVSVTADLDRAGSADGLVVPGVGAYAACMAGIEAIAAAPVIRDRVESGRPVLGICVGMQILFERGIEHGVETEGCGQWPGVVERLRTTDDAPVPHMGWNTVDAEPDSRLFEGVAGERFYFVHSYGVREWQLTGTRESVRPRLGWTSYGGDRFVASVENGPLSATQFHPEKSGDAGAVLLHNWVRSL
jgi:glutamine amidotransferase